MLAQYHTVLTHHQMMLSTQQDRWYALNIQKPQQKQVAELSRWWRERKKIKQMCEEADTPPEPQQAMFTRRFFFYYHLLLVGYWASRQHRTF